jgi:regulator of replication initiation timing
MWISKQAWSELLTGVIARYEAELTDWKQRAAQYVEKMDALRTVNTQLRERLIEAEAAKRAAQATRDLLIVQNGQLQEERGQFLQKILNPEFRPQIRVPKIESAPTVTGPGVDFEDMGDAAAAHHGYADNIPAADGEHVLERLDDITLLTGRVYDPASELGAEQPRLGDEAFAQPDM